MSDHEQTLRDAEKVLRLIGSPCPKNAQGHDHEWHECPRCEMLHELEQRDSLARRLVLSGADALARDARNCGNCKHLKYPGPYRAACGNPDSPFRGAVFNSYEAPNHDGCIKGWATREAE